MATSKLKNLMLLQRSYIILFLAVCMGVFGYFIIKVYIVGQAQEQVKNDLRIVRAIYQSQLKNMALVIDRMSLPGDLKSTQKYLGLDYLRIVPLDQLGSHPSDVVQEALRSKKPVGAARIMGPAEIQRTIGGVPGLYNIQLQETPRARLSSRTTLDEVMTLEYARPLLDAAGDVQGVLFGGKVVNRNNTLVDEIVRVVFGNGVSGPNPRGTVTLFQDDVRIATNAQDQQGRRAIGTRVSEAVYRRVVEEGENWYDRAFVVKDWSLTAYEPIRDVNGHIIGILYVGIPERPFQKIGREIFLVFLVIVVLTSLLAGTLSMILAQRIHRPLAKVAHLIREISEGKWDSRIDEETGIRELNELIEGFHVMAGRLEQREASLAESGKRMEAMNKDYLELVGFVSHELKGILSSIVLNTYLLSHKVLGEINPKQEATLCSMAKNLDYLSATVRNFLNLSRIEKGELKTNPRKVSLKADILKDALDAFANQAKEKGMTIVDEIPGDLPVTTDPDLMQVVVNNLVSNAVKYGRDGGRVVVSAFRGPEGVQVEVYNDGTPIIETDLGKLFRKFSRLLYRDTEKVKGTGVGLYITREIVEKLGGRIWVETRETGNSFKFLIPGMG